MAKYKHRRIFTLNNPFAPRLCPELAKEIGLEESVLLLQIEFWMAIDGEERDDGLWLRKPVREIQETFEFWHIATIARALKSLIKSGYLVEGTFDEGPGRSARWVRLNIDKIETLQSIRLSQKATTVVAESSDSVAESDNRPYREDQDHIHARAREGDQEEPPLPPVSSHSKAISKRPAMRLVADADKPPKDFLFPDRLNATDEIVEFGARYGYEGEALRDSIDSMRIKRLRDNKRYRDERELALDIQYWIKTCAQNRDKREGSYG